MLNSNLNGFSFGYTSDGKAGYKVGADAVVPFKRDFGYLSVWTTGTYGSYVFHSYGYPQNKILKEFSYKQSQTTGQQMGSCTYSDDYLTLNAVAKCTGYEKVICTVTITLKSTGQVVYNNNISTRTGDGPDNAIHKKIFILPDFTSLTELPY